MCSLRFSENCMLQKRLYTLSQITQMSLKIDYLDFLTSELVLQNIFKHCLVIETACVLAHTLRH